MAGIDHYEIWQKDKLTDPEWTRCEKTLYRDGANFYMGVEYGKAQAEHRPIHMELRAVLEDGHSVTMGGTTYFPHHWELRHGRPLR